MTIITAFFALLAAVPLARAQQPDLEIASHEFLEIADITVRNGEVYVADAMARAVLVFDESGAMVRTIGREGRGPLEFRRPDRLGWLGDTLWVRDPGNQRFMLIHGQSEVGTIALSYPVEPADETMPPIGWGEWLLRDGAMLIAPLAPWNILAQGDVAFLPYFHKHRAGGVNRPVFERDLEREIYGFRPSGTPMDGGMFSTHPYAPGDVVTVAADGSSIHLVNRSGFRVTRMSPEGRVLWRRQYPFERQPARRALEEFVSFMVELMGDAAGERGFASPAAFRRAVEDGLAVPDHLPPVSAALAGPGGSLWVRREGPASSIYFASPTQAPGLVVWEVIDAGGEIVGSARLPIRFEALHAESDAIWGVLRDELGVPSVVRYRLGG